MQIQVGENQQKRKNRVDYRINNYYSSCIFDQEVVLNKGDKKTSDAQIRATKKWEKNNKERTRYLADRRQARSFIRNYATEEDMQELEKIIEERRKTL